MKKNNEEKTRLCERRYNNTKCEIKQLKLKSKMNRVVIHAIAWFGNGTGGRLQWEPQTPLSLTSAAI